MKWFQKDVQSILKEQMVVAEHGLSTVVATQRQQKFGKNQLASAKKINPLALFMGQFKDVLVIILLIAAVVSWGVGAIGDETPAQEPHHSAVICDQRGLQLTTSASEECNANVVQKSHSSEGAQEALLIIAIVIAIATIGFFNEYKAEKTVEALKKLVGQKAKVRRGGTVQEIDAVDIVPGDIVLLEEGAKVPADLRLIQVRGLQINEASLTGESVPVSKQQELIKKEATLGDQKNMAFAGTFVTQGTAEGVVVAIAQQTELGKIATLVNDIETEETPMQRKLDELGKKLGILILAICAIVFVIVLLLVDEAKDRDFLQRAIFAFTAAVALAVAAIPEGLAFVVRISLALGARRMASKNALVRRLSAVEALGSTDVICSDKTGTLTKGEMTVREIYAGDQTIEVSGTGYEHHGDFEVEGKKVALTHAHERLLLIGALCNNARLKGEAVLGDPTEGSLLISAMKAGYNYEKVQENYARVNEIPFTSERKFMTTIHRVASNHFFVASKGSVEATLVRCTHMLSKSGKVIKLKQEDKERILLKNNEFSRKALRVLAFAYKEEKTEPKETKALEKGLVFVGLQAMMDPPRTEVIEVIHRVQTEAGMRVIMITGDYIETAKAVAEEVGINGEAISGAELEAMSQEEFEARATTISVYARLNPEHKIRIVKALKKHGYQVAMTGDGVNDAPAIKAADIGIAMGITGTDASKEAADLILLDDKFLTIISAIEEGRGIFDNVRKFVNFLISCNIAEVLAILFGILFFNNLLLTAAQLLFINIVTDGLPAVALGSDPTRADVLKAKPSRFQEAILTKRVWTEIFIFGSLMTAILLVQYWYNHTHESTMAGVSAAFTAMVVYELVRLVDIRTDYKIRWFSNPLLSVSLLFSLLLQFTVLYIPFLASYFEVGPLSSHDWWFMLGGSLGLFVTMKLLNPLLDSVVGPENHAA